MSGSDDMNFDPYTCSGCGAEVDDPHSDDCPVWAEQRNHPHHDSVRLARLCLIENLDNLPHAGVVTRGDWLNEGMDETAFLDTISEFLIEYGKVLGTVQRTTTNMAEELHDWRTLRGLITKLLGPTGAA